MPPNFSSENVAAINNEIYMDDSHTLAITRLFFHKVSFIFKTLLATLSKTLYTSVVKFLALLWCTSREVQGNFKQTATTHSPAEFVPTEI
jgi:hypothetical protein